MNNYYNEIKDILIKNESYKKVKDYSKNRNDLMSYYEVGKLLIEAQGGEERAKYGDGLIKEYSKRLTKELGKGYTSTSLKRMRQFFLMIEKGAAMRHFLTWTHYRELLPLKNINEINYYINISINQNLGYRELRKRIKEDEYNRLPHKNEISKPKVNTFIKDPIILEVNKIPEKIIEADLHNYILENMEIFLRQLGDGFAFIGHEYKIKINGINNSIDFLLFNVLFNCYVVIEVKARTLKAEDIGQTQKYIGYVDDYIKKPFHGSTFGIIVCRENNKYVLKYVKAPNIEVTTLKLKEKINI